MSMLSHRFRTVRPLALLALLAVSLAACDTSAPPEGEADLLVAGVNFTRLFAPATDAEVAAVRAEWSARAAASQNVTLTIVSQIPDPTGATVYVVSHPVTVGPGAPFTHYGLVRVPAGAQNLPVLVVHHGGDQGMDATLLTGLAQLYPDLFARTVQVAPVYRSEELRPGPFTPLGGPYRAGGQPSPWDYDVDDGMALLSGALARFAPNVNATRLGAIGFSRGGNVALLHAARDSRIRAVTDYFGPADFYNESVTQLGIGLLLGDPGALGLPGGRFLLQNVLAPLRGPDGGYNANADYARGRLDVVRRSASLFTADLPATQVHHHRRDPVVPISFSIAFDVAARARAPRGPYEFTAYGEAGTTRPGAADAQFHAPQAMPESLPATERFMRVHLLGLPAVRPAPVLALAD